MLTTSQIMQLEERAFITYDDIRHQIPIHIRISDTSMDIFENDDGLSFGIIEPSDWTYAKITATNKDTLEESSISITPKKHSVLKIYEVGEYWIEANIKSGKNTFDVFDSITISSEVLNEKPVISDTIISERPIIILVIIFGIVTIVGLKIKNR